MICVFGIIGVAQAAIMAHTLGHGHLDVPTQLEDLLLTVGVATFSFFGQSAIVLALKVSTTIYYHKLWSLTFEWRL